MLAMFYVSWFEVSKVTAALLAGIYPFINLVARPGGGWISDKIGRLLMLIIAFTGITATFMALGLLAWKLSPAKMDLIDQATTWVIYATLVFIYLLQTWKIWQVNSHILKKPVPSMQRYKFKQVAILDCAYLVTFGTELAVVSMLMIAMGFIMKTMPQINIMSIGFSIQILAGLSILVVLIGSVAMVAGDEMVHVLELLNAWVQSFALIGANYG